MNNTTVEMRLIMNINVNECVISFLLDLYDKKLVNLLFKDLHFEYLIHYIMHKKCMKGREEINLKGY